MKKMKRYEKGGVTEGQNTDIDDETRTRAMKSVEAGMMEKEPEENFKSTPRTKPAMPALSAASSKPKSTQYGASVPSLAASTTYGGGLGRRSNPEYPEDASKAMADMKKKSSPDVTKMSANERTKQNIEDTKQNIKENLASARSGSGKTDSRSVNERIRSGIRSTFGFAKGGSVSASSRADGIAQRGKTRGKMC